ncbi:MAG: bifunctional hydroxymethylpyrimidine kinase/phosphomethylpyrimidine kinase [Hyphomicrobiales bacterium]
MAWPTTLTIAGSDSGGGAGIQADLKTFAALGTYGASVVTAITAQNTRGVGAVMDVPAEFVTRQIDAIFDDMTVHAVKIGMLSRTETIRAVAEGLQRYRPAHVVVDPVMVAKSGDCLLREDAMKSLRDDILPLADLATPNLPEALRLLGLDGPAGREDMEELARRLTAFGPKAVLLKGGHLESNDCLDLLHCAHMTTRFSAQRIATRNIHGTGCTLSSAITALLARGHDMADAVRQAKLYLSAALKQADTLDIGHGHGPVHHFYRFWRDRDTDN